MSDNESQSSSSSNTRPNKRLPAFPVVIDGEVILNAGEWQAFTSKVYRRGVKTKFQLFNGAIIATVGDGLVCFCGVCVICV